MISSLLLILSSCAPEEKIITQTKFIERNIDTVQRPRPVTVSNVNTYVVNESNLNEFLAEFNGQSFVVFTIEDYEKLVVNLADIKRYITQSKQVIVYYERSVTQ